MLLTTPFIFFSGFNALAVWPFIFLKERDLKNDPVLINHERIHLKQQMEMLWIIFFLFYLVEFLAKIVIYKKPELAYRNISFEREAYAMERDFNYTEKKSRWSFVKYLYDGKGRK